MAELFPAEARGILEDVLSQDLAGAVQAAAIEVLDRQLVAAKQEIMARQPSGSWHADRSVGEGCFGLEP